MPELPDVYSELRALQENRRHGSVYRPSRNYKLHLISLYLISFHDFGRAGRAGAGSHSSIFNGHSFCKFIESNTPVWRYSGGNPTLSTTLFYSAVFLQGWIDTYRLIKKIICKCFFVFFGHFLCYALHPLIG